MRYEGKIKFLSPQGWGFIRPFAETSSNRKNLFFHACDLLETDFTALKRGSVVSYEESLRRGKSIATQIQIRQKRIDTWVGRVIEAGK